MIKLLENTFRAVNIGLVNEIALMCEKLGLDVWEVIDGAATKPFGFMRFYPGPGIGGHCIPLDPHYLSWKLKTLNYSARFIELAAEINGTCREVVVRRRDRAAQRREARACKGSRVLRARRRLQAGHERRARVAGAGRHEPARRSEGASVSLPRPVRDRDPRWRTAGSSGASPLTPANLRQPDLS